MAPSSITDFTPAPKKLRWGGKRTRVWFNQTKQGKCESTPFLPSFCSLIASKGTIGEDQQGMEKALQVHFQLYMF